MDRRYTVAEIDALRSAIEDKWLYGQWPWEFVPEVVRVSNGMTTYRGRVSRPYKEGEKVKCVEEMLRTYMLAGLTVEDMMAESALGTKSGTRETVSAQDQPA